jgi:pullulanase/glycogen debranching enzyme
MAAMNNASHALIDQGVAEGKPFPLVAVCTADGVNFSVYSKNGIAVELHLFDHVDDAHPSFLIPRSFDSPDVLLLGTSLSKV